MSAQLLDGRRAARHLRKEIAERVKLLVREALRPGLAVVLAGEDPGSAIYVRSKERIAKRLGIYSETWRFPASVSEARLREKILELNADPQIHGILVQLPLPSGVDEAEIISLVSPDKDVDGFHPLNLGRLLAGQPGFIPCTPAGCMHLLREARVPVEGRRAVVLGRSLIVGKPMAQLLLAAHATVTICHSRTQELPSLVKQADILVAAVGRPNFVRGAWLKPGVSVIDVGINYVEDHLCGDVAFEEAQEVAAWISPVPGGVGPMTIAQLMHNLCLSAERQLEQRG